jgi:hypothetical protein
MIRANSPSGRHRLIGLIFSICLWGAIGEAGGQMVPDGYQRSVALEDSRQQVTKVGGAALNYPDTDSTWAQIQNDWLIVDDTLMTNRRSVLKTDVNHVGQTTITVTINGHTCTVSQRLIKMIWINTKTHQWTDLAPVAWNRPSVDSNVVHWQDIVPGIDYQVRKTGGQVDHAIMFRPTFLNSALALYDQRADSADIALGNVIAYELTGVDHADSALGTVAHRKLSQLGKYWFGLRQQRLRYPGGDSLPRLPVKQRWIKQNGKIYAVEFVMMSAIKQLHQADPTATIWHNASTLIEDDEFDVTYIYKYAQTTNYSTGITAQAATGSENPHTNYALFWPDLSAVPAGSNIDSVKLHIKIHWGPTATQLYLRQLATDWSEAAPMCWDSARSGSNWAGGLGYSASDWGSVEDSLDTEPTGNQDDLYISSVDGEAFCESVQDMCDNNNYGFHLEAENSNGWDISTEDHGTAANHPELTIWYTTGAAVTARRKILTEQLLR